jgi:hypothetical protein
MKNLQSFILEMKLKIQYHDTLNPKLWSEKGVLDKDVRDKLMRFADTWKEFANIPDRAVKDVIMTGGNANYNYTDISDIDVHLIVDKDKIAKGNELLDDYLQDKKMLWTMAHDIKIKGYPLEPYAQDYKAGYPVNQGAYSLKNNKWVQKPKHIDDRIVDDKLLKQKVKFYGKMIDDMIKNRMSTDAFSKFKQKLRDMRGAGIQKGGEFSFENLLFKELRNRGYLDKMNKYEKSQQDKALTL